MLYCLCTHLCTHLCTLLSQYIKVHARCCNKYPKSLYHHMICALSTKNGINTFQKVLKYLNIVLAMCIIISFHLCKALPSSVCSPSLANTNRSKSFSRNSSMSIFHFCLTDALASQLLICTCTLLICCIDMQLQWFYYSQLQVATFVIIMAKEYY